MAAEDFFALPGRLFMDSCTLQVIGDYGPVIFDNESVSATDRIVSVTNGLENLWALQGIFLVNQRANFEWMVSDSSRREALDRGDPRHTRWFDDVFGHAASFTQVSGGVTIRSHRRSLVLDQPKFGYLSVKDKRLLKDAVALQCDAFLTVEQRLPKNATHLQTELGIRVLQPVDFWQLLRPWAGLWL